jgi:Cys-rich repeat protein
MRNRFQWLGAILVVLVGSSCGSPQRAYQPTPKATPCLSDSDCMSGQVCDATQNVCSAPGSHAGSSNDAGIIDLGDGGTIIHPQPNPDNGDAGPVVTPPYDAGSVTRPMPGSGSVCAACSSDANCGGTGNFCLKDNNGVAGCGATCQTSADCTAGNTCFPLQDSMGKTVGNNCFPTGGVCGGAPPPPPPMDAGTPPPPPPVDAGTPPNPGSGSVCATCAMDSDCGGTGNYCLQDNNGVAGCGTACQTSADCAAGNTCYGLQDSSGNTVGSNCFPTGGVCGGTVGSTDGGTVGSTDAGTVTPPPPSTDAGTPAACTPDTWGSFAQSFLVTNCTGCHTHSFDTGGGNLDYPTVAQEQSSLSGQISTGRMPPGRGLSSSDKSRILAWLNCGAPQ